ncbi:hypothetical protein PIB30_098412 [Stylosanthes scabra]|uniref:Putative plant transposon protein domain-containing protein n=1 Tax=Stylosanthes scabra TaxID=79078 RepID=A0ABU6SXA2_9FABA|nr:hypothetical protein [Stylosanthes scabra]
MRFRTQVQGAATDFETRKEHDQQLDQVLADLCMSGAIWKFSTSQLRVPIQLRRQELNPIARGWHEFSIHSLIPSSNRSEIPVIRAILIHYTMRGEDVRAKDIIADKILRMAQGIKEKGKLGFPSTIYKLLMPIAWSFNPRGINTPLHCGILLDTIRYTCRDLGFANLSIKFLAPLPGIN